MKTCYSNAKITVKRDSYTWETRLLIDPKLTDAEKSAARDEALEDIMKKLEAAGVLDLVVARERISEYRTDAEIGVRAKVIAGKSDEN